MDLETWFKLVLLFGAGGLTPGPAVMLVLASSFRYGFKPAMLPAFGIASANVLWLLLAASGAFTLITAFPSLLTGMKITGLLVIIYMAYNTITGPIPNLESTGPAPKRSRLYAKGVGLQISSPLPLVYFGLLLPLYFRPDLPLLPQFFIMLATVTATELLGLAVYAYGAAGIRQALKDERQAKNFNILIGTVMIASGIWAILSTSAH